VFPCFRNAVRWMLDQNWNTEETNLMRRHLVKEGWHDHSLLPEGWKVKGHDKKINSKQFLSHEAIFFKSYKKAQEHIREYMTEADLARFAEYAEGESKAARTTSFQ